MSDSTYARFLQMMEQGIGGQPAPVLRPAQDSLDTSVGINLNADGTVRRDEMGVRTPRYIPPAARSKWTQPTPPAVIEDRTTNKIRELNSELDMTYKSMRKEVDRLKFLRAGIMKAESAIERHQKNVALYNKQISRLEGDINVTRQRFESSSPPSGSPLGAVDRMLKDEYDQDQKTMQERINKWETFSKEASNEIDLLTKAIAVDKDEMCALLQALKMREEIVKVIEATLWSLCRDFEQDTLSAIDLIASAEVKLSQPRGDWYQTYQLSRQERLRHGNADQSTEA